MPFTAFGKPSGGDAAAPGAGDGGARVAFGEITPECVPAAMTGPRALDMNLVRAQQARRALDYL